jgi:hypothetical protein
MGTNASRSCESQKTKLDNVVYICCTDERTEFNGKNMSLIVNDRKGALVPKRSERMSFGSWRTDLQSEQQSEKDFYDNCCTCRREDLDMSTQDDRSSHRLNPFGKMRDSSERKKTPLVSQDQVNNRDRSSSEQLDRTDEELRQLSRAVEAAARKLGVKAPNFANMQAT